MQTIALKWVEILTQVMLIVMVLTGNRIMPILPAGLIRTALLCSLKAECKGLNLTSISRRLVYGVVIEDIGHPLTNPRQTADKGSNAFCTVPLSILQF